MPTDNDHDTDITLKDNPAYATTTNNTVSVDDDTLYTYASYNSSNLHVYSTILDPYQVNIEYI